MRIVADSSVALKWWLDDEEFVEEAKLLLKKAIAGDIEIVVPELWYCEIVNGITVAVKRNRISEKQGLKFIEELSAIPAKQYQITSHMNKIFKRAVKYKSTSYDMTYLIIAELEDILFITGDKKLFDAVKHDRPFVKYVSDVKKIISAGDKNA